MKKIVTITLAVSHRRIPAALPPYALVASRRLKRY